MTSENKEFNEFLEECEGNDEFPAIDIIIEGLREELSKDRTLIANLVRLKEMQKAYMVFQKIILSTTPDAKIKCGIDKLLSRNGFIEVETDEIIIKSISEFIHSIKNVSNIEVYPLKNGNIKLTATFQDIMVVLPQE